MSVSNGLGKFIFLSSTIFCYSFKWHLSEVLESKKVLTISEKHMFSNEHGPYILPQGESYIKLENNVAV